MTISTQRLQEVLRARIGQEFDGECHLTEAEANEIIEALSQAEADLAGARGFVETTAELLTSREAGTRDESDTDVLDEVIAAARAIFPPSNLDRKGT